MNLLRTTLFSMGCVVVAGCETGAGTEARKVTGQLSTASLSRVDNPAVVARSADGAVRVARVARTGDFELTLPVGVSTRLTVATATREGGLREDSTIVWPNRWTVVSGGAPIDLGVVRPRGAASRACSRDPGELEGGEDDDGACGGRADLPYDAKIPLGAAFRLTDAFLEKGPAPARIVSVAMEGSGWRLAELKADTEFVVTRADCDHAGNRDQGRDRVVVAWENADGSRESDHLDLRYCDGSAAPRAAARPAPATCRTPETPVAVCDEDDGDESVVDDAPREGVQLGLTAQVADRCPAPPPVGVMLPTPPVAVGAACAVSASCGAGLACFQSKCVAPIN
jgi:hypothetical protein